MARLIPVSCPKCGAEVELDPGEKLVKCTYCGTSSFVSIEQPRHEEAQDDTWESEARRAEIERREEGRRAEEERERQAQQVAWRQQDEERLRRAAEEEQARQRARKIAILVLAALTIGPFVALYLTK